MVSARLPDVRFLQTFRAVVEAGSFASAGRHVGLTQPGVSYQVRRLEEQLDVELFDRDGRGAVLTPAGRVLHRFCVDYLDRPEDVASALGAGEAERADPFRIASVAGFGRYVLFPRLREERFAGSGLILRYLPAAGVYREVAEGAFDLGFVYRPKASARLRLRAVYREELVMVRPSGDDLLPARDPGLDALEATPFVTYEESDYVFGAWFEAVFSGQPGRVRSEAHVERLEEVLDLVADGRGVSVVPADCLAGAAETVEAVRPGGARCLNPVYAVHRAGGFLREQARNLLATFEAVEAAPVGG